MFPILAIALAVTPPANTTWTHLPDGRWMFVDPSKPIPDKSPEKPVDKTPKSQQYCDYEHQCYEIQGPTPVIPALPPPTTTQTQDAPSVVKMYPKPEYDPYCVYIKDRLFRDLDEVAYAHLRCERPHY